MLSRVGGSGGRPSGAGDWRTDVGSSAEIGRRRVAHAVPGDPDGIGTGAPGPDLSGRGLPGDRDGGIVSHLSSELVEPAAEERAGAAGALDLFLADPGRRSVGALRGRRDGTAAGDVGELANRAGSGGHDRGRGAAAGTTVVERRTGRAGTGGPPEFGRDRIAGDPPDGFGGAEQAPEQAAPELVRALVVARSTAGASDSGQRIGGLLLERGRSQRARDSRYQRDGHVCGDRGTLVSGNPGADDAAENRLRRGDS